MRHRNSFFLVFNFFWKTSQQNGLKFLEIIAIYILHYHDFFQKNWSFSLGVISFKKKAAFSALLLHENHGTTALLIFRCASEDPLFVCLNCALSIEIHVKHTNRFRYTNRRSCPSMENKRQQMSRGLANQLSLNPLELLREANGASAVSTKYDLALEILSVEYQWSY